MRVDCLIWLGRLSILSFDEFDHFWAAFGVCRVLALAIGAEDVFGLADFMRVITCASEADWFVGA